MSLNIAQYVESLYQLYEQKIYRIAFSILRNSAQAEDVTQDVFLLLFEKPAFEQPDSLETRNYIYRIAKNRAIDLYRNNQRNSQLLENIPISQQENPYLHYHGNEHIASILAQIPQKYQEIILYRGYYGLSSKEVSEILNIEEATVRKRYQRAKILFQKLMEGEEHV